jgi:hypothetical protein
VLDQSQCSRPSQIRCLRKYPMTIYHSLSCVTGHIKPRQRAAFIFPDAQRPRPLRRLPFQERWPAHAD